MKRILWNDNWFFSSDIDPQPRAVRLPHDAMQTEKRVPGRNEITVIADNSQFPNSRWYSGSGIYRDVVLHTAGKEYIRPDVIRVTANGRDLLYLPVEIRDENGIRQTQMDREIKLP